MMELTSVRKAFGPVVAVRDVSFTARDGQVTGLLGPNGAGKTTTLRMLYGALAPDGGQVRIDGLDAASLPARRRIGALPDARGLYPRLSARENIRYYGSLHGMCGASLDRHVDEMIDLLDMRGIADRRTAGFSTGQRLKVALGRALVHAPANVLLDEPTSGLDVMSARALRDIIRRLRDEGRCVLLSTHAMHEVSALCDVVVVVASGRVCARGAPAELRAGCGSLEEAFVQLIGTDEGMMP